MWIVDPDGAILDRNPEQFLSVARNQVQGARVSVANLPDVDPTLISLKRPGFEYLDPRYVHWSRRGLRKQERIVHGREPVVEICHFRAPICADDQCSSATGRRFQRCAYTARMRSESGLARPHPSSPAHTMAARNAKRSTRNSSTRVPRGSRRRDRRAWPADGNRPTSAYRRDAQAVRGDS